MTFDDLMDARRALALAQQRLDAARQQVSLAESAYGRVSGTDRIIDPDYKMADVLAARSARDDAEAAWDAAHEACDKAQDQYNKENPIPQGKEQRLDLDPETGELK